MIKLASNCGWRPIAEAPKDGTWIIGYRGGKADPVYVTMRWWDGISPEDLDDLSGEEEGEWVGRDDHALRDVTHWLAFTAHPDAPPVTTSFEDDDTLHGIRHLSRVERGITQEEIDATRAAYAAMEEERERDNARHFAEIEEDEHENDNQPSGGHAA